MSRTVRMRIAIGVAVAAAAAMVPALATGSPHVTNRCPVEALPLRASDLAALRRLGLAVAPHGLKRVAGGRAVDFRDARATADFPTFYTGYVRTACPKSVAGRVLARTADVRVAYPRVNWSASLSSSTFLVARTPHGFVAWAQMH